MIEFGKRNLKIFYRDKAAVFFSLFGVLIILGLYVLFLRHMWIFFNESVPNIDQLVDSWVIGGILGIVSVTTTLGSFAIMVDDKSNNIFKDFYSSPIEKIKMVGGYIFSACTVGLLMSLLSFILAEIAIVVLGGKLLSISAALQVLLLILLVSLANTSMVLFFVTFFESSSAFASVTGLIGTFIGFLAGVYIPIGMFPKPIQWFSELIPVFHGSTLLRRVMMQETMDVTFVGEYASQRAEFEQIMGVSISFGNFTITPIMSIGVLIATIIVFTLLSSWRLSKKVS